MSSYTVLRPAEPSYCPWCIGGGVPRPATPSRVCADHLQQLWDEYWDRRSRCLDAAATSGDLVGSIYPTGHSAN